MKWWNILSALYGVSLSKEEKDTWEYLLKKHNATNEELCAVIEGASERKKKPINFKITATDLIEWIKMSRNNWQEPFRRGF